MTKVFENAFSIGTEFKRVGFAGPVRRLRTSDTSAKTRNKKDGRGSPVASPMPK